ncbi:hypothetical protein [Solirhodobacter olei]|nr:hypothetical protein [Solirhodobacter olei]
MFDHSRLGAVAGPGRIKAADGTELFYRDWGGRAGPSSSWRIAGNDV